MAASNGRQSLTAATPASIVQAGASGGTYNVEILNATGAAAVVKLGISSTDATFEPAGMLINDLSLADDGQATFKQIVLGSNEYIVGESDTTNVNMVAMGFDE